MLSHRYYFQLEQIGLKSNIGTIILSEISSLLVWSNLKLFLEVSLENTFYGFLARSECLVNVSLLSLKTTGYVSVYRLKIADKQSVFGILTVIH